MDKWKSIQWKAGYEAGYYGPNMVNSNFRLFGSEEATKEWEEGNRAGKEQRAFDDAMPLSD